MVSMRPRSGLGLHRTSVACISSLELLVVAPLYTPRRRPQILESPIRTNIGIGLNEIPFVPSEPEQAIQKHLR